MKEPTNRQWRWSKLIGQFNETLQFIKELRKRGSETTTQLLLGN